MTLSLCICSYNRPEMLLESFASVINDNRIEDVEILDDESEIENYNKIFSSVIDMSKVHLYRNAVNLGMAATKRKVLSFAKNDHAILFDDDNILDKDYVDNFERLGMYSDNIIFMPSLAAPEFDYSHFEGVIINKSNIDWVLNQPRGDALMNTCNYIVPKYRYLEVYEDNPDVGCADTCWFNYLWLKRGYSFYVVPGMTYTHRLHPGSGFMQNLTANMKKIDEIKTLMKLL
jgi:glycosyltransferase involved in cell wall biosynthesis